MRRKKNIALLKPLSLFTCIATAKKKTLSKKSKYNMKCQAGSKGKK
jgi:hypothetical protein